MYRHLSLVAAALLLLSGCPSAPPPAEPCKGVTCGNGHCVVDGTLPACLCDEGFKADKLRCVAVAPVDRCQPNPCVARNQTTCGVVDGGAVCACNAGYASVDGGCPMDLPPSCADQHGGDPFEPDECPAIATPVSATDLPLVGHTIEPAGDADWFKLTAEANRVYSATAIGTSDMALYLDAYAADASTVIGFDHLGTSAPLARFKALKAGTLYVRVRAVKTNETGAYALKVTDLGIDDYPDTAQLAPPLSVGAAFAGALQFPGDLDVVQVSLFGSRKYGVGNHFGDGGFLPSPYTLELLAADRVTVLRNETGVLKTVRPDAGDFYLRVSGGPSSLTGGFQYGVIDLGLDDHGESPEEATLIAPTGNNFGASFERGDDRDYFAFDGVAGRAYRFECSMSGPSTVPVWLYVNGPIGSPAFPTYQATGPVFVAFRATLTGRYTVAVLESTLTPEPNLHYFCRLQDLGTDDHGDDATTATALVVNVPSTGRINSPEDADFFRVSTTAGHIYRASCASNPTSDCEMRLLSATGAYLDSLTGSGSFAWESAGGGDYFIRINHLFLSFDYAVRVDDLGVDDHGNTLNTATTIVPGPLPVSGSLETRTDVDVFRFAATASNVYRFVCVLSGGQSCAVKLKDALGAVLAEYPTGANVPVAIEASAAATYFFEVTAGIETPYTWRLDNVGPDDFGDDAATASPITAGAAVTGTLETPLDLDVFSFSAVAGRIYRFTCTTTAQYAPALRISNAAGTVVAPFIPGALSLGTASFKAAASGTFTVKLSTPALWSVATYSVSMEDLGLDDHGDTGSTATALTLPTSATAAVLEFQGDTDFFSFDAVAGHVYRFDVSPDLPEVHHVLRDTLGTVIAGTSRASSQAKAALTGKMYAEVSTTLLANTPYTYAVVDLGLEDHGDTPITGKPVTLGTPTSGTIDTETDVDFFSVVLAAGATLTIAPSTGALFVVTTATGQQLSFEAENPAPFVATTAGTYFVRVRALSASTYPLAYAVLLQ